jgi:hypothetical protein
MFNASIIPTADLIEIANFHVGRAHALADRLEEMHPPERMARFFPPDIAPLPDAAFAKQFGDETVYCVIECGAAIAIAATAGEELATRRWRN